MKCRAVRNLIPDVVRERATPEERKRVDAHLAGCEACREDARRIGELFARMHDERPRGLPQAYWASLLPRIHQRIEAGRAATIPEWVTRFAAPLVAALAVLVVVLIGLPALRQSSPADNLASLRQMPGDELQEYAEQQSAVGLGEGFAITGGSPLLSDDHDVLADIVRADHIFTYSDLNPGTGSIIDSVADQDADEVVAFLQQQHPTLN